MAKRVMIVTIDGWGTNLLGTYGVSLCETPNMDHFAAHSVVFDRSISNSAVLLEVLQSIADGLHPCLRGSNKGDLVNDFREWLSSNSQRSLFITDSRDVLETEWADRFTESLLMEPATETSASEGDSSEVIEEQTVAQGFNRDAWMETGLALFVGEALAELTERQSGEGLPDLIWLHMSGLTSSWDAPYEFRLALCDEEDPRPSYSTQPAAFQVDESTDLDHVFQAMCGASAQAKVIDHIWSWIEAFVEQIPDRESLALVLAGTRGYPLGEHASVGIPNARTADKSMEKDSISQDEITNSKFLSGLHSELVHVPLLIQPGFLPIGYRVRRLVQPTLVNGFVRDWLDNTKNVPGPTVFFNDWDDSEDDVKDSCWIESEDSEVVCTKFWTGIFNPKSDELAELYLSPDDRWQQNNIGNRALEIADAMTELRVQWQTWKQESIQQLQDDSTHTGTIRSLPTPIACLREPV